MSESEIHAFLEDGPRAGELLKVQPGPDGEPPAQVVVGDPFGEGGTSERRGSTTYHLHELDSNRNAYLYRTGRPE